MGQKFFTWLILGLLITSQLSLFAQQDLYTRSKRAIKFYEEALTHFTNRNDNVAMDYLKKAIRADKNFIEAYFMLAQMQKDARDFESAIKSFRKGLSVKPSYYPDGHYILAQEEYNRGMYKDAFISIENFLKLESFRRFSRESALIFLSKCEFAISQVENPVPFKPVNLGDSVNSEQNEYWPSLSLDETRLIFTVLDPIDTSKPIGHGNRQEDFYESIKRVDSTWSRRRNLGPPLNTPDNEGAQTISGDGRFMFFTGCNRPDGFGMCDIYFSRRSKDKWSVPRNIGSPVNTQYSEKHPSTTSDGRWLFFASDRPGGKGELDIYRSRLNDQGEWSVPENLGNSINTPLNEQAPFIHPDGKTLYFTSEGHHNNLGQSDIFMSRLENDEKWTKPVNLGYPINTHNNELGLIVNSSGELAYFASDRHSGEDLDIYKFELYPEVRPDPVSYMKGRVFDSLTYKGLEAVFRLTDIHTGDLIIQSVSAPGEGNFLIPLPSGRNYALNVSKTGYMFYSGHFAFDGIFERAEPYLKDVPLQPVITGQKIVLNNIFFDFDKAELKKESDVELNRIKEFLQHNSDVKIQLNGHTDNIGTNEYNQVLSEERAFAVVRWLAEEGISPLRLKYKGYGASIPVASNETEEGRALNRRTEMQIID